MKTEFKQEVCKILNIPMPKQTRQFRNPYQVNDFEKDLFSDLYFIKEITKIIREKLNEIKDTKEIIEKIYKTQKRMELTINEFTKQRVSQ